MTDQEIKQELIRSALNDTDPFYDVSWDGFNKVCSLKDEDTELMGLLPDIELRLLFLIVAESL